MLKLHPLDADLVIEAVADVPKPRADIERQIEAIWVAEQARRSTPMVNGALFSLISQSPGRLTGGFVEYRWFIAQQQAPGLFEHTRVRPLAVSGLLLCADGVVFGRREMASTQHPGRWELAPSGGVDRSCLRGDGTVDYVAKLLEELAEETGCPATAVTAGEPFVLVEDVESRVFDIGVELRTEMGGAEIIKRHGDISNREYTALEVVPLTELADFVTRRSSGLVDVSRALLIARGLLSGAATSR
jgi:hypothetical protein